MIWVNWALVAGGLVFVALGYLTTFSREFALTMRGLPARFSLNLLMAYVAYTMLPRFSDREWAPVLGAVIFLALIVLDVVSHWGRLREECRGFLAENRLARRVVLLDLLGIVMIAIGAFARFVEQQPSLPIQGP
jgi:hypothetical protein